MTQEAPVPPGLSQQQVVQNRQKYGSNTLVGRDYTTLKLVTKSVFSVYNIIMAVLIAVLYAVHEQSSGQLIGLVAVINTTIEVFQEVHARMIIKKIGSRLEKKASVVRDDRKQEIPIVDLVIGDIVLIAAGDRVPVDGELVNSSYAEFDESILTGESKYISKRQGEEVRAGSFVTAGSSYYQVTKLAKDSFIQDLTKQVGAFTIPESPLQSQINQVIKALTYMTIFFIILLVAEGIVSQNRKEEIIVNSSVLVTSLIPQGLVLITTISFAYGAIRIARNQAIVQRLSAIETMANTKVVCMDKTGTLTKNTLEVKEAKWLKA